MLVIQRFQALRDRALNELSAAHDYYVDTKMAWRIVQEVIREGRVFTIRNMTTGSITQELQLATKARDYVTEDLAKSTFQQFVSIFEYFVFDFLRCWLVAYPQSLNSRTLPFKDVLDSSDKEEITLLVVNKELNEIAYDRPREWFAYLESRARLGCPSPREIELIGEAKACRDVLTHNRGIANKIYETKAGDAKRFCSGERLEISEQYHGDTWELFRKVISDLTTAVEVKLS